MGGRIRINTPDRQIKELRARASSPWVGSYRAAIESALRREPERNQRQRAYVTPTGLTMPWPRRIEAFQPVDPPLNLIFVAWAGGPHGFSEGSGDRVVVGVIHPSAPIHRGGRGVEINPDQITEIAVTDRMRGYIAAVYGVHLRKTTRVIRIPARAHAGGSPQLVRELEEETAAALLDRRRAA